MSMLDDANADAWSMLTDPDATPGAEPITYRPGGRLGSDVTVNANVTRQQVRGIPGMTGAAAPSLQIFVTRADVPNPQPGDEFLLPTQVGGKAERHPFARRISEDAGGFLLELR